MEDIQQLILMAKRQPKQQMMATYYARLTQIFAVSVSIPHSKWGGTNQQLCNMCHSQLCTTQGLDWFAFLMSTKTLCSKNPLLLTLLRLLHMCSHYFFWTAGEPHLSRLCVAQAVQLHQGLQQEHDGRRPEADGIVCGALDAVHYAV